MIPSDQEEVAEPAKATGKKGKKDRKKKKEAELEDAQKELESIAAGDDGDLANVIGKYLFEIVLFDDSGLKIEFLKLCVADEKPSKKEKKSKKTKVVESDDEEEEVKPKEKATKSKKKVSETVRVKAIYQKLNYCSCELRLWIFLLQHKM